MDSDSSKSETQSSRLGTPPRKQRKRHYDQKYSKLREKDKEFAGWLQESTKGEGYFYRKSCRCDLKCSGGRFILNKHKGDLKKLIQNVCLDSEIAEEITSEKTKAQAIVTNVTGKLSHSELVKLYKLKNFLLLLMKALINQQQNTWRLLPEQQ
ncbi:hypothetical protein WA026_019513 [Henosepilachna vigintioctopunctata]|uniref:Uncharacterized protein n=1 Tax=Henosepilachna vigintioctopunctata TaxID=420089 RepID=A0AAW1TXB9_9CUCU